MNEEGRKKQHSTSKVVTFLKKNELPRVGLKSATLAPLAELPRQLSWLGPNLTVTSDSTPDDQANYQCTATAS